MTATARSLEAPSFTAHDTPFPHHVGEGLLSAAWLAELEATWPQVLELTRREQSRPGGDKVYAMHFLAVRSDGEQRADAERLPEPWARLCAALDGPDFRAALGEHVGLDLTEDRTEVGIYAHDAGDGVTVHRDKQHKSLSCIVYLDDGWDPAWGGGFCLYAADDLDVPVRRLLPAAGQVVAFAPRDDSWHAVDPLRPGAPTRRTLQIEFAPRG